MRFPHVEFRRARAAVPAEISRRVPLQIVSPCAEPPEGDGSLHEIKHDGHRLLAIIAGGELRLINRSGHDRTELFRLPFEKLRVAGLPPLVLDGEIAVPDEKGVTHIDALSTALRLRRYDQLAYFAFDLLHLDGHDLRCCAIEDRKALLRDLVGAAACERIVSVDYMAGKGTALFAAVRQVGAEGIVSKRAGSRYGTGTSRDWLKTKVSETGAFVITGCIDREMIAVAELKDDMLMLAGTVKFGLANKDCGSGYPGCATAQGSFRHDPVRPELVAAVRYFGRYRTGWILDGVLLSVG